jgi:branched-chain amino acid transport system substrate-binding protein
MGFDMLEAVRCYLRSHGNENVTFFTENIGFGEDHSFNYARAEKLVIQDEVDLLIAYSNSTNAEPLYKFATALQKPVIILDAGMQSLEEMPPPFCYHISLQGLHACRIAGHMAGEGKRKVLMATSFYDGGYRGPWSYDRGLSEAGGSVCGNYVSGYKTAEFNIDNYIGIVKQAEPASVAACFSSYLAELFFKHLSERRTEVADLPFYCSPFMAEEALLAKCDFPGGDFYTVVPWASSLVNEQQEQFKQCIGENKTVNIFHLLGWEAGIVAAEIFKNGIQSLKGFSYHSPRGEVVIHPLTQHSYSSLYRGRIIADSNGKCTLGITEKINVEASDHITIMEDKPGAIVSGWKNNYLCI